MLWGTEAEVPFPSVQKMQDPQCSRSWLMFFPSRRQIKESNSEKWFL